MSLQRETAVTTSGPRCSDLSLELDEPIAGTAPVAQAWLVIEQPGPWGRQALLDSRLPEGVGATLTERAEGTGTTVLLARRPGRASDPGDGTTTPRRFWLAHTSAGGVRMRTGVLDDVQDLLGVDLRAMARGELPPLGKKDTSPVLFVCANAKRDACCALLGRPLAADLGRHPVHGEQVWESSHLGGHRFAPTALLLPWGTVHGRLDLARGTEILDAAAEGRTVLTGFRGRTALRRWLQAAEIAVREAEQIVGLDALHVLRSTPSGKPVPPPVGTPAAAAPEQADAEVRHQDGRAWRVTVSRVSLEPRPESCGKDAVESEAFVAGTPLPLPAWH